MNRINPTPLRRFSLLFVTYIWLKRIRMIAFRILILAFIFDYFAGSRIVEFESSGSTDLILWLIFVWIIANFMLLIWMNKYWRKFAEVNGFDISSESSLSNAHYDQQVPSFQNKKLALSLVSIRGYFDEIKFSFFTRIYKEGGIIRWREKKNGLYY